MESSCDSGADTPQGKEKRPMGVLLEWGILTIRKLEKGRSLNHCSLEEGDWCWLGDDQGSSQRRGRDEGYRGLEGASMTAKDADSQTWKILPSLLPGPATSAIDQLCVFGQLA